MSDGLIKITRYCMNTDREARIIVANMTVQIVLQYRGFQNNYASLKVN